jgi:hypothetical protein
MLEAQRQIFGDGGLPDLRADVSVPVEDGNSESGQAEVLQRHMPTACQKTQDWNLPGVPH